MMIGTTSLNHFFNKQSAFRLFSMVAPLVVTMLFAACSSSDDDDKRPALEDGKSTVIYSLAGDLEISMGSMAIDPNKVEGDFKPFVYSFKNKRQHWLHKEKEEFAKTTDWDIAFTGPYNAEIYINSANQEKSPGYQGDAKNTAVVLIKKDYDLVEAAPSDEEFDNSKVSLIGWSAIENDHGWFQYDEQNHIMKTLPNRTYVLRLANGKYAKLQIINAYKGNPQAVSDMNWPAPYYTFRYFVQEDGSKNLKTK